MIPKIIHQIAPEDKTMWHPAWQLCHQSVMNVSNNHTIFLWNDKEDIDNFIKLNYKQYFDFYSKLPLHILKIDFVRYCILHYYGGIYIDMDMFVYKDFHSKLIKNTYILNPTKYKDKDLVVNCIMASEPKCNFFKFVIDKCVENYNNYKLKSMEDIYDNVTNLTGPCFLYRCFMDYSGEVGLLESSLFDAPIYEYNNDIICKHMKTQIWGREIIKDLEEIFIKKNLSYRDGMKKCFYDIRGVDIDNFNFYLTYK